MCEKPIGDPTYCYQNHSPNSFLLLACGVLKKVVTPFCFWTVKSIHHHWLGLAGKRWATAPPANAAYNTSISSFRTCNETCRSTIFILTAWSVTAKWHCVQDSQTTLIFNESLRPIWINFSTVLKQTDTSIRCPLWIYPAAVNLGVIPHHVCPSTVIFWNFGAV